MEELKYPVKTKELEKLVIAIENHPTSDQKGIRDLSRKLLIEGTKNNCLYSRAYGTLSIGAYYLNIGDTDTAISYLHDALDINTKNQFNSLLLRNLVLLGNVHADYMSYMAAIDCYLQALTYANETNDVVKQMSVYNNIGSIFYELKNYDKAMSYFELACEKAQQLNNLNNPHSIQMVGFIYCNITTVLLKLNHIEEARKYLEISRQYILQPNDFIDINILINEATLYDKLDDYPKMVAILDKIVSIVSPLELQSNLFEVLTDSIDLLFQHHDKERIATFLETLKFKNKSQNNYFRQYQYQRFYVQYLDEFSTDVQLALDAYKELNRLSTLLTSKENQNTSKSLETTIELYYEKNEKAQLLETSKTLQKMSQFDELTGIRNRRGYNVELSAFSNLSNNAKKQMGLVLFDIDCFKEYNDNYGHMQGDHILRHFGKILDKHSSENIIPCRFGGDEFTALCFNCSTKEIEDYVITVMKDMEEAHFDHAYTKVNVPRVSLSCGFVNTQYNDNFDSKWLVGAADTALYYAKEHGRNQYCNYDTIK